MTVPWLVATAKSETVGSGRGEDAQNVVSVRERMLVETSLTYEDVGLSAPAGDACGRCEESGNRALHSSGSMSLTRWTQAGWLPPIVVVLV